MKSILVALSVLLVGSLAFGQIPASFAVSNTSCKVAAERGVNTFLKTTPTNNQGIAQGEIVKVGSSLYMALNSGAYTTIVAGALSDFTTNSVVYRPVVSKKRNGIFFASLTTNTISVSPDRSAVAGKGFALTAVSPTLKLDGPDVPQGSFHAICGVVSAAVSIQEW